MGAVGGVGFCHLPSAMHHADCGGHLKSHPSFVYVVACGRNVHEDGSVEGPDGVGVVEDRAGQAGEAMAGCLLWLSGISCSPSMTVSASV
jgi:hypothetical protein